MTTQTLTLAEFLLARIAEDEALASQWIAPRNPDASDANWHVSSEKSGWQVRGHAPVLRGSGPACEFAAHFDPARVLAGCEAKRWIVELHTPLEGEDADPSCGDVETPCRTMRVLARVYADHPDYDGAWRA